jgi:hypothetical protein
MLQDPQVKKSPRNFLFGYVRVVIIGTLTAVLISIIGLMIHWQPVKTVKRQQVTLLHAVESRKGARLRRLVASQYRDRWGFDANDITESMLDARSQFLAMAINTENQDIAIEGKKAVVTTRLKLGGTPIMGGSEIISRINRLDQPFVFTWEKQSFLPSSWRLVTVENKAIPDNVWNYEPGSIRAAMQGE